jgi:hypothetical protein
MLGQVWTMIFDTWLDPTKKTLSKVEKSEK